MICSRIRVTKILRKIYQNNNENLNDLIWNISSKIISHDSVTIKIATYYSLCAENLVLLKMFKALGVVCDYTNLREARQQQIKVLGTSLDVEEVSYDPGLVNSV